MTSGSPLLAHAQQSRCISIPADIQPDCNSLIISIEQLKVRSAMIRPQVSKVLELQLDFFFLCGLFFPMKLPPVRLFLSPAWSAGSSPNRRLFVPELCKIIILKEP